MRSYIVATGVLFALLTLAHLWRITEEPHLARDPSFLVITITTAALAAAAWRLTRRTRPRREP